MAGERSSESVRARAGELWSESVRTTGWLAVVGVCPSGGWRALWLASGRSIFRQSEKSLFKIFHFSMNVDLLGALGSLA